MAPTKIDFTSSSSIWALRLDNLLETDTTVEVVETTEFLGIGGRGLEEDDEEDSLEVAAGISS